MRTPPSVQDLVWAWLCQHNPSDLVYSDVTKGLCGHGRVINRLTKSPRQAVRAALHRLAGEGHVALSPTTRPRRAGRPGLQIEVLHHMDRSTYGGRNE